MNKILELVKYFRTSRSSLLEYYQQLFAKITHLRHLNFYVDLYQTEVWQTLNDPSFFTSKKDLPLFGIPFFLKDNFMVAGKKTTGGSQILSNFIPNFTATVVQLLQQSGAILLGKTTMDELSMGGTGLTAWQGFVQNPLDRERIVGGSSSGSAVAVLQELCCFALGSDTGDSGRLPASYLGIIGFKPTLGLMSRYGLISYSPSLDTVAILTKHLQNLYLLCQILFQHDVKDLASQKQFLPSNNVILPPLRQLKVLVIGHDKEMADPTVLKDFEEKICNPLHQLKVDLTFQSLPREIVANLTVLYQIISFSEALSSQANLTGANFGFQATNRNNTSFFNLIHDNRDQSFGFELKRRYLLGALFTSQEHQSSYFQALKMRTYINNYFAELFTKFDFIIHLAAPDIAPTITMAKRYQQKRIPQLNVAMLLLIANFGGFPSIVIPFTKKNQMPIGFNIFANFNQDFQLLKFSQWLKEQILND